MKRGLVAGWLLLVPAPVPVADAPTPFEPDDLANIVAARQGRPLAVVLRSVGCAPCVRELPLWREAMDRNPGFDVVPIAVDAPEDWARVHRALARAGITRGERRAFGAGPAIRLRFEIDRTWRGELPRAMFYNADGTRAVHAGALSGPDLNERLRRMSGMGP